MTEPGSDILAIVRRELNRHEGVFIGETHEQPFAAYFLTANMRTLREAGVTTLYIELPHESLIALRDNGVTGLMIEEYGQDVYSLTPSNSYMTAWSTLIEAAELNGIRIIGYDPVNRRAAGNSVALRTAAAMEQRDSGGASIISATHNNGSYIILGGSYHSRIAGSEAQNPSAGLPERLGIASIDFIPTEMQENYRIARVNDGTATYAVMHRPNYLFTEGFEHSGQLQMIAANVRDAVRHGQALYEADVVPSFDPRIINNIKSETQLADMLALIRRDSPAMAR